MKKINVMVLSIFLITISILIVTTEKSSSFGIPIADAGEDQIVNEGDVVQFNGTGSYDTMEEIPSESQPQVNYTDPSGGTHTLYYNAELNASQGVLYDSAGYLVRIDVYIYVTDSQYSGAPYEVILSFTNQSGNLLGNVSIIANRSEKWYIFRFSNPIHVAAGGLYYISVEALDQYAFVMWVCIGVPGIDPYPKAHGYWNGIEVNDFTFKTYLAGTPPGPLTYEWDFDSNVDSDGDGNKTNDIDATGPTPTNIYGDDGIYRVTLKVTDNQNLSATDTCNITVNNIAPTIQPIGPFTIEEGFLLTLYECATDPGSDDLIFTWSWGDGTSDTIKVYYNDGVGLDPYPSPWGTFPFSAYENLQHLYSNYGVYTLNLKVEDDDGGVSLYKTNVTVIGLSPPTLHINTSLDGKDTVLYWDPPPAQGIDHYLIYRSTSQRNFDFNNVWKNTSIDKEPVEPKPIPLRTMWNDTNAAFPGNVTNYEEQYYYVIRAVNIFSKKSCTSRTVGKWTTSFQKGVSTFSIPLEPLQPYTTDYLLNDLNAKYIKWMHPDTHVWMKHGDGCINDTQMKVGEGYEIKFNIQTNYTFTGMPGAMISYDDDGGFFGFNPNYEGKNLTASLEPNGDITLTWQEPSTMVNGDRYNVYYSKTRDGFFGKLNVNYFLVCPNIKFGTNSVTYIKNHTKNIESGLYFMVVPFNASGVKGTSTYSLGIWTEEYLSQYDTFGIPLKLNNYETADWYCDNIPDTVGINYFNFNEQRWCWHSSRMPAGAYDPLLTMTEGYQISTSNTTKFTFIGV